MKIERAFTPVVLTIETPQEMRIWFKIINRCYDEDIESQCMEYEDMSAQAREDFSKAFLTFRNALNTK